jgi:hypothetical protein
MQTRQFALLPSIIFLTLLSTSPKVHVQSGTLELLQPEEDTDRFAALDKGMVAFKVAMKLSKKRGNGKKKVDEEANSK